MNPPPDITLRQYAAIHLMIPDSGIDWLDTMIDQAREQHYSAAHSAALTGALARNNESLKFSRSEQIVIAEVAIDQASQITYDCDDNAEYHQDTINRAYGVRVPGSPNGVPISEPVAPAP